MVTGSIPSDGLGWRGLLRLPWIASPEGRHDYVGRSISWRGSATSQMLGDAVTWAPAGALPWKPCRLTAFPRAC
jgi:hypothetical protein